MNRNRHLKWDKHPKNEESKKKLEYHGTYGWLEKITAGILAATVLAVLGFGMAFYAIAL